MDGWRRQETTLAAALALDASAVAERHEDITRNGSGASHIFFSILHQAALLRLSQSLSSRLVLLYQYFYFILYVLFLTQLDDIYQNDSLLPLIFTMESGPQAAPQPRLTRILLRSTRTRACVVLFLP